MRWRRPGVRSTFSTISAWRELLGDLLDSDGRIGGPYPEWKARLHVEPEPLGWAFTRQK